MSHNILTIRAIGILHNWCQERRAIPISAPGGGERGVRMEERPHINAEGVPSEMLTGDQGEEGTRSEPRMNALQRALALTVTRLRLVRPDTSVSSAFAAASL
jgi:hypothetical protein